MKTSADDILAGIFAAIDDGSAFKAIKKTPKKEPKLTQVPRIIYKFHAPTLKPIGLVLVLNETICQCCGDKKRIPGKHILVEKQDKYGNKHYTRYMTPSNIAELPRRFEVLSTKVPVCACCFEDAINGEIHPVTDEDAEKSLQSEKETFVTEGADVDDVEETDDEGYDRLSEEDLAGLDGLVDYVLSHSESCKVENLMEDLS